MPPPRKEHLAETLRDIYRRTGGDLVTRSTLIEAEFGEKIAPAFLGKDSLPNVRWYLYQKVYLGNNVVFPNSAAEESLKSQVGPAEPKAMSPDQESRWRRMVG